MLNASLYWLVKYLPHSGQRSRFSVSSHTWQYNYIRPLLTLDTAKAMAVAIAGSRLDYCNSVLHGMSQANINRLQRVQNILGCGTGTLDC